MRVVVAPDSFKGSLGAAEVARHLAAGWRRVRPDDVVVELPMADGGEGTLDAVAAGRPDATRHAVRVTGPDGAPVDAYWLQLPDGTALVELALASGLPLLATPDPLGAHTVGLGEALRAAITHPATRRVEIGLGGSATTDGGSGALTALGAQFLDRDGGPITPGGGGLQALVRVDLTLLHPAPVGGVDLLTDVRSPLLGPDGAAAVFAPQKGANEEQVAQLEAGLQRLATVGGGDPSAPGAGAAGGAGYGLATFWGGRYVSGADRLMELVGLAPALAGADLVITGEGRFDRQSLLGKVVGRVLELATECGVPAAIVAGGVEPGVVRDDVPTCSLTELAGGSAAAIAEPGRWLHAAATELAGGRAAGKDW